MPNEELYKFLKQAKRLGGEIFIVSNSRLSDIKEFADYFKMDLSIFKKIIVNDFDKIEMTKQHIYSDIMHRYNYLPQETMVIGNSVKNDLKPAQRLKMHTYHVTNGFTYEEIVE